MKRHRIPVDYGDQLHFEPNYFLRFSFAWGLAIASIIFVLMAFLWPELLVIGDLDSRIVVMIVEFAAPLTLGGAGMYLRGQYLCLDRHSGQILEANGFSGHQFGWNAVGVFDPAGTMNFQYCQAELQSLCVMSYQTPGTQDWLILHIYTNPATAKESAQALRQWEKRLTVTEMEDQSALPAVRGIKPLVY